MKTRIAPILCGILVIGLALAAVPTAAAQEGGAASAEEKAVLDALQTLYAAYPKREKAVLEKYYSPDLIYTHSAGNMDDKAAHIDDVMSKRIWEFVTIKSSKIKVQGSVAVVRAVMDIKNGASPDRMRVDADRNVTLFLIKGPQNWQVVLRQ